MEDNTLLSPSKKDLTLFHAFKQNPTKYNFNELYNHMKPVINSAIHKYKAGSGLPSSAFDIEAAQQFFSTINTFDPSKNVQLKTKVYADMQKVSRLNMKYQNLGRIPEARATKIGDVQNAIEHLKLVLGREPNSFEISKETGMSSNEVEILLTELRKDLIDDGNEIVARNNFQNHYNAIESDIAENIYFCLNQEEKDVFDYIIGRHGKPCLQRNGKIDYTLISKNTGISEQKVISIRNKIYNKFKKQY